VLLDGERVSGVPNDLAVVFQDYGRSRYPWLTVRDNAALPLRIATRYASASAPGTAAALSG
jgi:ABC-type nitrate/sulfonate/bicarbonate transport system ATPase subunit